MRAAGARRPTGRGFPAIGRPRPWLTARAGVSFAVVAAWIAAPPPSAGQEEVRRGLTAAGALARAYDAILDARFDAVPGLLGDACGPAWRTPTMPAKAEARTHGERFGETAPPEACQLLDAVSVWWRIQLDPYDRSRDVAFQSKVEAAIAATTAWTTREPYRAEAWLYRGGAYGARVQWRALRGERLAAARDGARIKEALERALALDPAMTDAYFGLGLYHYYADVVPSALKVMRWLLLLPGGDRVKGLQQMVVARQSGQLFRSEADYQLHVVYVWYEKDYGRAIELLQDLQARHPHNPHFAQTVAEIQDFYIDDTNASLAAWEALLEAADRGQVAEAAMARASAKLGIAAQLDQLSRSEAAIVQLQTLLVERPQAPAGLIARAHYQLGLALEHAGRRSEAGAAYRDAIAAADEAGPSWIAPMARAALRAIERQRASANLPR